MIRKTMATAVATAAAAALTLSACGAGDTNGDGNGTEGQAGGGTLTFGAITSPTTFDPAGGEWGNRSIYYQAVYDTLLLATPEGEIDPWLATEWEYNDDNTELTLTIRDDVTFSDGEPLDAEAVVTSMNHFMNGSGPDIGYMANVSEVSAPDASTVVVSLSAPDPAFLDYLTRTAGLVASPSSLESESLPTDPVGSGPYVLDTSATVTDSSYVYTRNPDYWNPDVQHYESLVVNVLPDMTAAMNAIQAGEANVVKLTNSQNNDQVESAGWTVNLNELDFQGLLLLDRDGTMNPAIGDVRVRQALNYAFDKEGLLQALQNGNGSLTTQVFPESSAAYDPELDDYYEYDPERARELLAEAGYEDGFTIQMPSSPILGESTFTLVAQQMADIGITVEYTDPGNNFIADLLAPQFAASFMVLEQNPDWQLMQFMLAPGATFNPFGYSDPEVDRMLEEFQYAEADEQDEIAREINTYIVEQAWFAPFYRSQGVLATDTGTTVEMLPTNTLPNVYDLAPLN